uniref:Ig-like domain-containing protein n=1 Tax=Pan paniscus TaxID=9597 RepID=A0A2R8ZTG2_PANPA
SAVVSQHPSRVICKSGTSVNIECRSLDFQATTMFWYRQLRKQCLMLMATSNEGSKVTYEQGVKKDKFPINHPNLTFSALTVTSAHPEDSSFYICSARDTVPGGDQRPRQELLQLLLHPSRPTEC